MRIGIDARAAAEEPGGRGRVVRELLSALARSPRDHEYVLYGRRSWDGAPLDGRFAWALTPRADPWWHVGTALRAGERCDAFLSSNSYLTAWFTRIPTTIVVYDMVPWVEGARGQQRAAAIERVTLGAAIRRAAAILCISESTRRDLLAHYPHAEPKARVVHLAADPAFGADGQGGAAARHGIDKRMVLAPGTLEPRKNLPRLIEAFAGLPDAARDGWELVLVGATGWETDATFAAISGHQNLVRTLGYVSDRDLRELYAAADVIAYPSLYEGFGLPVLEGMQSGTAVLTSNVSSMPEVGGDAVRYADPLDVGSIRAGLASLMTDGELRAALAARGRERARQFTWDRMADQTLDLIEASAR